jgi:hypothetical protein
VQVAVLIRQTLEVTSRVVGQEREAAAYHFARTLFFKKVVEADDVLKLEAMVSILGGLKDECKKIPKEMLSWIGYLQLNDEADCKLQRIVLVLLVRVRLCTLLDLDLHIANKTNAGQSLPWVELAMQFVRHCVVDRIGQWNDFGNIFDALGKAAQRHGQSRKINKFMEDLRTAAGPAPMAPPVDAGPKRPVDAVAREQVRLVTGSILAEPAAAFAADLFIFWILAGHAPS